GSGDAVSPEPAVQAGSAGPARAGALVVSPNPPLGGLAQLRYALPQRGAANVRVYDAAGRVAASRSLQLASSGVVPLDVSDLVAGVYVVRLEAGPATAAHKLVISR
ncbi:T9SS type A sorting domain-containing protein, partial [candidate division WOR-3 bacterium]|nr:T9SS type A sorting domain-containing protein [candidate division WOR-3 bacterium]